MDSLNEFGIEVFRQIPADNIAFSPVSLICSLLMILTGTRGSSSHELGSAMFNTVSYPQNLTTENVTTAALKFSQLFNRISTVNGTKLVNNLFLDEHFDVLPEFIESSRDLFKSTINSVNFQDNNVTDVINKRLHLMQGENGEISKLIDDLSPYTKLLLVNILNFKKEWKYKFDARRTKSRIFHTESNEEKPTEMMYLMNSVDMGISEDMNCTLIKLPYKGNRMALIALLPREGMLIEELVQKVSFRHINAALENNMQKSKTKVIIPKFTMAWTDSLVQPLSNLGIKKIFSPQSANFKGISSSSRGLFLGDIKQKVTISLDEEGSKATASTVASFKQRSLSLTEEFIANRPFIFLVGNFQKKTLTDILFMGKYFTPPVVSQG